MATVIRMPAVLAGSAEAAIATWLVSPGEKLSIGVPLAEVETEKAIVEYASEHEGIVLRLLVEEGVPVGVGDPIAIIGAAGESAEDADVDDVAAPPEPDKAAVAPVREHGETSAAIPEELVSIAGARVFMSPLVRRLAKERDLDLATVSGTGPSGRIVRRDVESLTTPPVAPGAREIPTVSEGGVDVPHTAMRRAIARRLTQSKSTVPHFYLVADCRVDRLIALRTEISASGITVSINDFVLKACAASFVDVPEANVIWGEKAATRYSTVDMSVAIAVDGGLVTPVLRSVERLTLTEIARGVADLADRARAGRLKQNELEGGSFAVSNLGMYGVTEFSAIINPPQSGILAVGRATQRPAVVDGALAVATIMTVTLSADHRVLDGALAAKWLAAFVKHVENPVGMLI